ncbi:MAG: hypothetical protein KBA64_05035 [Armatimonadetes bacterium]|nr:hypothetical protein [Armatimonadota bacterium]
MTQVCRSMVIAAIAALLAASIVHANDEPVGVDLTTRNEAYQELIRGLEALYDGDEAAAEQFCRNAIAINPMDSEAHFHLGRILGSREGDEAAKAEAIEHFAKAAAITPYTSTGQSARAWIVGLDGRHPAVVLMTLDSGGGYTRRLVERCAARLIEAGHPVVAAAAGPDALDWEQEPGEAIQQLCIDDRGKYVAGYVIAVGCYEAEWLDVPAVGRIPVASGGAMIGDPIAKMRYEPVRARSSDSGGHLLLKLIGVDVLTLDRAVDELAENLVDNCMRAIESRPISEFEGEVYYPVTGDEFIARALRRGYERDQIRQFPTVALLTAQSPGEDLDQVVASAQSRLEWKVIHSEERSVGVVWASEMLNELGDAASLERSGVWLPANGEPEALRAQMEALETTRVRFPTTGEDARITDYNVIIVERGAVLTPGMADDLREFVHQGGGLILRGCTPWDIAGADVEGSHTVAMGESADWLGAKRFRRRSLRDCDVTMGASAPPLPAGDDLPPGSTLWCPESSDDVAIVVLEDLVDGAAPVASALKRDEVNCIAYCHEYGEGRVYYQSVPRAEYHPQLEALFLRGVTWAAKVGEVDEEVLSPLCDAGAECLAWLDFVSIDMETESSTLGLKQKAVVKIEADLNIIDLTSWSTTATRLESRKSAARWLDSVSDKRIRLLNECMEEITDDAAALIAAGARD